MDGVFETVVGYCGGESKYPTYHRIGDHMESIQVRFDPQVLAYEDLLKVFWKEHDYTCQSFSRQYMNAVFYHNEKQHQAVLNSKEPLKGRIETEILPTKQFYPAEDYHQKYYLQRHSEVRNFFLGLYPVFTDFVASTSAARINGILGGYRDMSGLAGILKEWGIN